MLYKMVEIMLAVIVLVPVFGVLHKTRFHNTKKTAFYFLFAVYLSAVYLFVGMPTVQFIRFELSLTWIPFLPMIADLKNTVLNVVLFVPLGMLLPFLWRKYNTLKATALCGFGMSLAIELLQILTYRATDVNDVIANTVGTVLGYILFRAVLSVFPSAAKLAGRKNEVAVIMASVIFVMFFIQPCLAAVFYKIT